VSKVEPGGPADAAGIRNGDVILSVGGEKIKQMTELPAVIAAKRPGTTVRIDLWRGGKEQHMDVVIGRFEQDKMASAQSQQEVKADKLGLAVRKLTPDEEARMNGEQGLFVERAEGAAAAAGLRRGDVILAVGSTPVNSADQLVELAEKSGNTVALLVQRNNQRTYVPLQTG
jgi:serine protease Do